MGFPMLYKNVDNRQSNSFMDDYTVPIRKEDTTLISLRAHHIEKILCDYPNHSYLISFKSNDGMRQIDVESLSVDVYDLKSVNPTLRYETKHGYGMQINVADVIDIVPMNSLDIGIV